MINLKPFFPGFSPDSIYTTPATESFSVMDFPVNEETSVIYTHCVQATKENHGDLMQYELPENIKLDDLVFVVLMSKEKSSLPTECTPIFSASDKNVHLTIGFYSYQGPTHRLVHRTSREQTMATIVLRGSDVVLDTRGMIDPFSGRRGSTKSPRVRTEDKGVVLSVIGYKSKNKFELHKGEVLVSAKDGDIGLIVGIHNVHDESSQVIEASVKGKASNIIAACSIY